MACLLSTPKIDHLCHGKGAYTYPPAALREGRRPEKSAYMTQLQFREAEHRGWLVWGCASLKVSAGVNAWNNQVCFALEKNEAKTEHQC